MTRKQFMVLAAIVPGVFGLVLLLVPDLMLDNSLTEPASESTTAVARWVGFAVVSLAWITFMSRTDPGSPALWAVLTGNVLFHALGTVLDVYGYAAGTMTTSGMVTGAVPHVVLGAAFVFYLTRAGPGGGACHLTQVMTPTRRYLNPGKTFAVEAWNRLETTSASTCR